MANDLSAFNSEAWSARLVTKLDQINVMRPLVNTNWEGDLKQNKTVWVRTPGNVTMAPYSRGTEITYQDLTPTKEAFTVTDGEYFAFEVDDIDKAQSDVNAMDVYMKRAVVAMNNQVDSKILAAYTSTPSANQITGASGDAITLDSTTSSTTGFYQLIVKARTLQSKANVPKQGRWMIVDPDASALLYEDTAHFIRAGDLGDKIVQTGVFGDETVNRSALEAPGFIGQILGYDVYESVNIPVDGSGNRFILFGDSEAISYAAQITEIEALRLQDTFANAVRGLLLHGTFVPAESAKRLVYIKAAPAA